MHSQFLPIMKPQRVLGGINKEGDTITPVCAIGAVITTAGNNLPAGTSGWGKCNINMLMNQVAMILCLT